MLKELPQNTISFVMPCYNDGNSIEKAVRSIKDQDLPGIEMIVVDDGSTDNTRDILKALEEQALIDKLILLDKNEGACVARNKGAKEAKGVYLSFLPADAILYPGSARIWWNILTENPDYDFLYGGYRFIDEEGEPLPGHDMFFEPLEPYLLEVTNYIDGSFPIKRESFWKFANIMKQPEGLWDKNVKSLQDWDFWLSVVRNGGKGLYVRDIFFGTTIPHEGGLSYDSSKNWLERTGAIKKKHGIPERKGCVASLGAGFHAKRVAYLLGADFKEMPSFKPHNYDWLYIIGFYPEFAQQQDSMFLNNVFNPQQGRTSSKKLVHFVGSDIWQLYHCSLMSLKIYQSYFKNNIDKVLCEADFTQAELKELGIDAEVVPIPPLKLYEVKPLPKEFTMACYQPQVNAEFYKPQEMYEIAKRLPDVKFKFFGHPSKVGTDPALPSNIEFMGYINDMEKFLDGCSAIMRFPIHDGLPIAVLEFLLAGRYSVQTVPIKFTSHIPIQDFTIEKAVEAIKKIREEAKEPNYIASEYWREQLDHEKYRNKILKLANYDPKEYWENRAKSWSEQAKVMSVEHEEIKPLFDRAKKLLKKENPSILDIGCGDGRWYPILKEWKMGNYSGIDISDNLVKAAQFRFPAIKDSFQTAKVEDLKISAKQDIIFSYTCLEHVKEEDFPKAVEAIKKAGKLFIIVEPTGFISRNYCHDHSYEKVFTVVEKIKLKDKIALLCSN